MDCLLESPRRIFSHSNFNWKWVLKVDRKQNKRHLYEGEKDDEFDSGIFQMFLSHGSRTLRLANEILQLDDFYRMWEFPLNEYEYNFQ